MSDKSNSTALTTVLSNVQADISAVISNAKKEIGATMKGTVHMYDGLCTVGELPLTFHDKSKPEGQRDVSVPLTFDLIRRYITAEARDGALAALPEMIASISPDFAKSVKRHADLKRKPDHPETPEEKAAREIMVQGEAALIKAAKEAATRIIYGVGYLHELGASDLKLTQGTHPKLTFEHAPRKGGKVIEGDPVKATLPAAAKIRAASAEINGVKKKTRKPQTDSAPASTAEAPATSNILVALDTVTQLVRRHGVCILRQRDLQNAGVHHPTEVAEASMELVGAILGCFDATDSARFKAEREKIAEAKKAAAAA